MSVTILIALYGETHRDLARAGAAAHVHAARIPHISHIHAAVVAMVHIELLY